MKSRESGRAETVFTAPHSCTASIVRKLEKSMSVLPSLGFGQDRGSPAIKRKGLTSAILAFSAISKDCWSRLKALLRVSCFAFQCLAMARSATASPRSVLCFHTDIPFPESGQLRGWQTPKQGSSSQWLYLQVCDDPERL